ncbi:hypothetical protein DYH10_01465 [Candidatus Saccharibacteria bacterium CPR2]|nr:hypothetical protein [Candidatus Saccharibacteria bacterium CPR2]
MEQNPKQQVVESLKNASNVLVTVSRDPNVDALSAALGFTLMLNKLDKHTTALVSGKVPHTMEFMDPQKTFENSVDSLRDFIISLDKNKADKLRYKVEDDVVKIYVTPYKTQITKEDIQFSQGDYNVDVVVALGVEKREDLDEALKVHGRILHDATILTINSGDRQSGIGSINWQDPQASSICEMLVSISEAFQGGLLDEQISTAFLTGIIAATNRFSSQNTTPKIMTMAAQLMATGANQQLIANNLQTSDLPTNINSESKLAGVGSSSAKPEEIKLVHDEGVKESKTESTPQSVSEVIQSKISGSEPNIEYTSSEEKPVMTPLKEDEALTDQKITELEEQLHAHQPDDTLDNNKSALISKPKGFGPQDIAPSPLLGGTFNATAAAAQNANEEEKTSPLNKTVLSHSNTSLSETDQQEKALPAASAPVFNDLNQSMVAKEPEPSPGKLEQTNETNSSTMDLDSIRKEVEAATSGAQPQVPSFPEPSVTPTPPSPESGMTLNIPSLPPQPQQNTDTLQNQAFQLPPQPPTTNLTSQPTLDNNQTNTNPPPISTPPPTF